MASGTFYPIVSEDDGHWYTTNFYSNTYSVYLGYPGLSVNLFVRFPNILIPQGAIITNAFVRFTCHTSTSNTIVNTNIYFNNIDDAVAPTSAAEGDGLALTGEIAWDNIVAWTNGVQYDTIDITSICQTIINRAGWSSNNALQVVIKDDGGSAYRMPSTIDYLSGAEKPELHVTWTDPLPEIEFTFTNPIPAHLSTVYGTTKQLQLTTTISGSEPSYTYDASFYDSSDVQIGTTVSGINSGSSAVSNANFPTPSGIDYSWYVIATSSGSEDTSSTYTFSNWFLASGTTEVDGTLTSGIDVRLYRRDTGELVGTTISTVSGIFNIETQYNSECYCVALSPYTDTNSLMYDFLEPGD